MAVSRDRAVVITAVWLAVGTVLGLWSYFGARRDLSTDVNRFEQALRRNQVRELRVQSAEMVEFEEQEDEGACYAFQLNDGRILFIRGQDYYPSARFPNTDFSLASIYDNNGVCIEELIHKRGHKLEPSRAVPASFKLDLSIPEHLQTIEGRLAELEGLLITTETNR